jgi:hypothetical protein
MLNTHLIYKFFATLIVLFTSTFVWAEGQVKAAPAANLQSHEIHFAKSLKPLNRQAINKTLKLPAAKPPRALSREEIQRAIKDVGKLSGKAPGGLKLNAGPVAVLTPDQPIGKGSLMVVCGNYFPTGFLDSTPRISIFERNAVPECGFVSGIGVEFEELTPGKTYLVDVAVHQQSGKFHIGGVVDQTIKPANGHVLFGFTETSTKSGFMLSYEKASGGRRAAFFYSASLYEVD